MAALNHKPQHMQQYAIFTLLETFSSRIPEKKKEEKVSSTTECIRYNIQKLENRFAYLLPSDEPEPSWLEP